MTIRARDWRALLRYSHLTDTRSASVPANPTILYIADSPSRLAPPLQPAQDLDPFRLITKARLSRPFFSSLNDQAGKKRRPFCWSRLSFGCNDQCFRWKLEAYLIQKICIFYLAERSHIRLIFQCTLNGENADRWQMTFQTAPVAPKSDHRCRASM